MRFMRSIVPVISSFRFGSVKERLKSRSDRHNSLKRVSAIVGSGFGYYLLIRCSTA